MTSASPLEVSRYRQTVNAWCLYDFGNSAFATTIMAVVFPLFFRSMATAAGLSDAEATAYWAYTTSIGLALVALLGPLLGTLADQIGGRKRFLSGFALLGIASTTAFVALGDDSYFVGSILFILGNVGFAGANVFYESLLPHVARRDDIDRVSARGYAVGYIGGGLLLVVNLLWITHPDWFFLPDGGFALRLTFLSVAVWWAAFTIPLLRRVTEPAVAVVRSREPVLLATVRQLGHTLGELRRYRQLMLFLLAFWIYNDGIGTIIKMAVVYGDEIGIGRTDLMLAIVIMQFVGIPCAFAFGWLAKFLGAKRSILLGLGVYVLVSVTGFFMETATHFYILAAMVGLVQGGTQALSRSLYAAMVPRSQSAEFFGFYSTSSKFAGIFGPLLFGLVTQTVGGSRLAILSLVVFFVVGGLLLLLVDEEEGERVAAEEDRARGSAV